MATLSSSFTHLILHRFIRQTTTLPFATFTIPLKTTPYFTPRSLFFTTHCSTISEQLTNDVVSLEHAEIEPETETETETENRSINTITTSEGLNLSAIRGRELPSLSVKEKKELGSYAHSLGKKLKSQQVGKSGVTDTVIMALNETLEKNELLKLKIHGTCPAEMEDAVKQIEGATGSVLVGQIGRTVILYRPSVTKMKAEEKKKENQRILLKRRAAFNFKQFSQGKRPGAPPGQEPREFGRGRRERSRY